MHTGCKKESGKKKVSKNYTLKKKNFYIWLMRHLTKSKTVGYKCFS